MPACLRSHKTPKCRVQCPAHTSFLRPERSTAACQKQARVDPTVHAAAGLTTLQQAAGVLDPSLQSTESENSLDTTSVQTNEPAKVLGQVLICKSETLQPEVRLEQSFLTVLWLHDLQSALSVESLLSVWFCHAWFCHRHQQQFCVCRHTMLQRWTASRQLLRTLHNSTSTMIVVWCG